MPRSDGWQFECALWGEVIHPKTAQAIATFDQDYYAGRPAVTRNTLGKGDAFYAATLPDPGGMDWLLSQVCSSAGIALAVVHIPAGVELVRRHNGSESLLFALNHSNAEVTIRLEQPGHEVLTGTKLERSLQLRPMQVAVVHQPVA